MVELKTDRKEAKLTCEPFALGDRVPKHPTPAKDMHAKTPFWGRRQKIETDEGLPGVASPKQGFKSFRLNRLTLASMFQRQVPWGAGKKKHPAMDFH